MLDLFDGCAGLSQFTDLLQALYSGIVKITKPGLRAAAYFFDQINLEIEF